MRQFKGEIYNTGQCLDHFFQMIFLRTRIHKYLQQKTTKTIQWNEDANTQLPILARVLWYNMVEV